MADENLDYQNLPFHIPYEGIHRDAYMSLHRQLNEPFRFEDDKLNHDFGVNHRFSFWKELLPLASSSQRLGFPSGGYEVCVNFINPSLMFIGNITLNGNLNARLKYNFNRSWTMKSIAQINHQIFQATFSFDYKMADYITQLQFGTDLSVKASCSKSVTPELSLHGEVSRNGDWMDVGCAARYKTHKLTAAGQVSTRRAIMSYFQKISEKVSFVADFMYNYISREVRARVGGVYLVPRGRWCANIDSNGVVAAQLEEQWTEGLHFILSTELDPWRRECKVGCGITIT